MEWAALPDERVWPRAGRPRLDRPGSIHIDVRELGLEELVLVDGYNLLGRKKDVFRTRDLESARRWLVEELAEYAHLKGCRVIVVFDGSGKGPLTERGAPGVEVIYSETKGGADQVIERLAVSEAAAHQVSVVTADYLEQTVTFRPGVTRKTPREFLEELEELKAEQGTSSRARKKRYPLEERLEQSVRQELDQLARGILAPKKPDAKS